MIEGMRPRNTIPLPQKTPVENPEKTTTNSPENSRILTLRDLVSGSPVHGSGYERFTDSQKKDLEALLSQLGYSLENPILDTLRGETLMDMRTYVQSRPNSPERIQASAAITNALDAVSESYREAT